MDLPVNIIILLFVALVVGIVVIQFAQDQIFTAKTKLDRIGAEEEDKFVIEMATPSDEQILLLAEQCYREGLQSTRGEETCFVVRFDPTYPITDSSLETDASAAGIDLDVLDVNSAVNAIFIKYNPRGIVEITK